MKSKRKTFKTEFNIFLLFLFHSNTCILTKVYPSYTRTKNKSPKKVSFSFLLPVHKYFSFWIYSLFRESEHRNCKFTIFLLQSYLYVVLSIFSVFYSMYNAILIFGPNVKQNFFYFSSPKKLKLCEILCKQWRLRSVINIISLVHFCVFLFMCMLYAIYVQYFSVWTSKLCAVDVHRAVVRFRFHWIVLLS